MIAPGRFTAHHLRTVDPDAAAAFYAEVAGWELERTGEALRLRAGGQPVGEVLVLPERARALGAPPHWLGAIGVSDLDAAAGALCERGGARLGPEQRTADGRRLAAVRDPLGAVLALAEPGPCAPGAIAWHELHTTDHERALDDYQALFGWDRRDCHESALGAYQLFAWSEGGPPAGAITSAARMPGIHTHWQFHIAVEDLGAALATVRARGGSVLLEPVELPGGALAAPCEDPWRAAFALSRPAR